MDHFQTQTDTAVAPPPVPDQLNRIVTTASPMDADIPTSVCDNAKTQSADSCCYPAENKMNLKQRAVRRCRRSRRRRKGKNLHRNQDSRATKQLYTSAAGKDENGNSWRYNIGAPQNDNEFLLNQSKWQLDPKSGTFVYDDNLSCPSTPHDYSSSPTNIYTMFDPFLPLSGFNQHADPLRLESDPETPFPYSTSDDDSEVCPICRRVELRQDSGVDSGDEVAHSPQVERHVCVPSSPAHHNSSADAYHSQTGGPDPSFVGRNFEAEYEENLTQELQSCTKEELVLRCKLLIERTKELESWD